jgi:hypothetical protein
MLREAILRIAREYPAAIREPLASHPLASYIRTDFRELSLGTSTRVMALKT